MFASRYHADMVVQVRKYDSIRELVKRPVMEGELFVAFKPDLAAHYEPMIAKLDAMALDERCRAETNHLNVCQQEDKKWKRYYCLSSAWVTQWITYCEAEDRTQHEPPGPVANEPIMQELCKL